jgi:putative ABC transport system permease protein
MDAVLRFFRKLRLLVRRKQFSDELEAETAFHREQAERDLVADGMSAEDARHAATRQFGNDALLREHSRDIVGFQFETGLQDLRYAVRQLRKNPGFAATAILILALGIGATTAIFSAVNPILFEPLPYPNAHSVTMIWEHGNDGSQRLPNFGDYVGLTERSRSFEAVAALKPWQPTMTGGDQPERLEGQRVSAPYFRVLGINPTLGRDFEKSDDLYRGPNVVILSYKLWQRRFGADKRILGQEIKLDDESFTVTGVMPASFENVLAPEAELWAPLQYNAALPPNSREWGHHLQMAGRLRAGVSKAQTGSELDVIMHSLAALYASGYNESGGAPAGFLVDSLQEDVTQAVRPALLAVFGAVMLVLLIACVNVTNLLLARAAQRRGEFAMRTALGAARVRLLRQLVTESLVLALLGGVFGMLVAELGVRALVALSPPGLPRLNAIQINSTVFVFALGVTTLIGVLVGIIPALHAARKDPHAALQQSSQRAAGGQQFARRALVVAEVGLALVLLVSAGLLLRSLRHLFSVDTGFDASHLLTMRVQEAGQRYREDAARVRFFQEALERVREVPGVESAGFTSQLPLSGDQDVYGVVFEKDLADNAAPDANKYPFFRYAVTPGYLETMRIPLLRGRLLNDHDSSDVSRYCFQPQQCGSAPAAVLISESFAKRKFGAQDPIGRRVRLGPAALRPDTPWATIVGVVGDVRQLSLADKPDDAIYVSNAQWFWGDQEMSLVVRTRSDPASVIPGLRSAIWSVDKDQPIVRVAPMERLVRLSEAQRQFAMIIFEAFALVALVLAATGIYGVLSGGVTERIREIGVRAALGASRADILGLIVRQGMTLTTLGVAIGLAGAVVSSRALITLLFGVSRLDPFTYLGVVGVLLVVSAVACSLPAWRAAQVDPSITLRAE